MAKLFSDGFDPYSTWTDASTHWDTLGTNWSISTTGRFTGSQSLTQLANTASSNTKSTGSNDNIIFINIAFIQTIALSGTTSVNCIQLLDGVTAQCSIVFRSDGAILVTSGAIGAATVATFTGAFSQNVWAHFQIKVTIHNTAGRVEIRKDGATSDTFDSGASINTRGGTTNFYANKVGIVSSSSAGNFTQKFDDFYVFNDQGAAPNTWTGDIKCKCAYPTADTAQKDFSNSGIATTLGTSVGLTSGSTASNVANRAIYVRLAATLGVGVPSSCSFTPNATSAGAKSKMAIYAGTASGPTTRLDTTNEVTGLTAGVAATYTFTGVATLSAGQFYWLAWTCDTVISNVYSPIASAASTGEMYEDGVAYATGFPATATGSSSAVNQGTAFLLYLVGGGSNFPAVAEALEDGDTSYVYSPTVTARDLYSITYTDIPGTIIDVTQRAFMKKSSSGTRNGQLVQKAGGGSHTVTLGTDTVESSSYTWHRIDGPLNPDTGLAWTPSEVAALTIGQQVSA